MNDDHAKTKQDGELYVHYFGAANELLVTVAEYAGPLHTHTDFFYDAMNEDLTK